MKMIMSILISLIFNFQSIAQVVYWEELDCVRKSNIISRCDSKSVLQLYIGDFVLSDNEDTSELISELSNPPKTLFPLYFYLFNEICFKSDGAISELLPKYCTIFIAKKPLYTLQFLGRENNTVLFRKYASYIGEEMYYQNNEMSDGAYDYKSLKEILDKAIDNKSFLYSIKDAFLKQVDLSMKSMD